MKEKTINVFIGLDVSLRSVAMCVLSAEGDLIEETSLGCEVAAISDHIRAKDYSVERISFEADTMSQALFHCLTAEDFDIDPPPYSAASFIVVFRAWIWKGDFVSGAEQCPLGADRLVSCLMAKVHTSNPAAFRLAASCALDGLNDTKSANGSDKSAIRDL